jgi:hypothetical protein
LLGADNAASQGLRGLNTDLGKLKSDFQQERERKAAERMSAADASGDWKQELSAAWENFKDDPANMTAQAAGSALGFIGPVGLMGRGAELLSAAETLAARKAAAKATEEVALGTLGTGSGVGSVKGQQYDSVQSEALKRGYSPEAAKQLAINAQSYSSDNAVDLLAGGLFGALAASTGIERMGLGLSEAAKGAGPLKRSALGILHEAPMEGLQGGQQQYAGNDALIREGWEDDPWKGVIGQAVSQAIATVPLAGVGGALQHYVPTDAEVAARDNEQRRLADMAEQARIQQEQAQREQEAAEQQALQIKQQRRVAAEMLPFSEFEQQFKAEQKAANDKKKALIEEAKSEYGKQLVEDPTVEFKPFLEQYLADRGITNEKPDIRAAYVAALDDLAARESANVKRQMEEVRPGIDVRSIASNNDDLMGLVYDEIGDLQDRRSKLPINLGNVDVRPTRPGTPIVPTDPHSLTATETQVGFPKLGPYDKLQERTAGNSPLTQDSSVYDPTLAIGVEGEPSRVAQVIADTTKSKQNVEPVVVNTTKSTRQPTIKDTVRTEVDQALKNGLIEEADHQNLVNTLDQSTASPVKVAQTVRRELAAAKGAKQNVQTLQKQETASAQVAPDMTEAEHLSLGHVKKVTYTNGKPTVEWVIPDTRTDATGKARVNKIELPNAVDTTNEDDVKAYLKAAVPDTHQDAVESYIESRASDNPPSLRDIANGYGISHTALANAVRTAKEAVARAGEAIGLSSEYATDLVGYNTAPEVADLGPAISEAAAAQAGLSYRKGEGPKKVSHDADEFDPINGYDRTESADTEAGDNGVSDNEAFESAAQGAIASESKIDAILESDVAADAKTDWNELKPGEFPRYEDLPRDVRAEWVAEYAKQLTVDDTAAAIEQAILRYVGELEAEYEQRIKQASGTRDTRTAGSNDLRSKQNAREETAKRAGEPAAHEGRPKTLVRSVEEVPAVILSRMMVNTTVFDAETHSYVKRDYPANVALDTVNSDIRVFEQLLKCIKG